MQLKKIYTFLFLLSALSFFAQEKQPKKVYTRIVFGPALSSYKNNDNHTINTKPRPAFYVGVYESIRLYHDFTFTPGIEYFQHGVSFDSYFIVPGNLNLYDKQFNYHYKLEMQEARLNILFRQIIGIETRNVITGYVEYGYVLRYLFNSQLNVTSNLSSAEMFSGKPDIVFEHPTVLNNMASGLKIAGGLQHNFFRTHRAYFFECSYMYSLSRFEIQNTFAPASLFIAGSFLQLGMGVKF